MEITDRQILDIQSLGVSIIFIDDGKRRNILERGFVVDWTVLSSKKDYFFPKKKKVVYFLGSQYTPLREEFNAAKKNKIKENIQTVMVTFGGSDVRNLTPTFLKTLNDILPNCKKNIIIGSGFANLQEIEKFKDKNTNFILNATASKMIKVMQESDLAIASGGQTLYELARIGTPAIAILLVENAKDDTLGWAEVGSVSYIGRWDDKKLLKNFENKLNLLKSKKKRKQMQNYAKEYTNPNGAKLLVSSIIKAL
jgi:spore coat polysaccharide biosynthesis predicted glycosyltransferase SpsG